MSPNDGAHLKFDFPSLIVIPQFMNVPKRVVHGSTVILVVENAVPCFARFAVRIFVLIDQKVRSIATQPPNYPSIINPN